MRLTLIACDVLTREVCRYAAASPHIVEIDFTKLGSHDQPGLLRTMIQDKIDGADDTSSELVVLGYGLCGNAINGLTARKKPLIVPRAHDCCTLFLGSKKAFNSAFGNTPSAGWGCVSYSERSDGTHKDAITGKIPGSDFGYAALVEEYGEDNARYVWDTLHPPDRSPMRFWIKMPDDHDSRYQDRFVKDAENDGKEARVLQGDTGLIEALVSGPWPDGEFLTVPPGGTIEALYDREYVIRTK